ncbi:hypothetical protein [Paracoccus sp. (in: a-proteobacteria)]|uniref:hypothetical protein n=1 Tax=Paracoccus sp. TaxID=267 RepID=UPI00289AB6C2|nr:hypothetical protein [Paracoccus sp. (in: a-proteobacteria)]
MMLPLSTTPTIEAMISAMRALPVPNVHAETSTGRIAEEADDSFIKFIDFIDDTELELEKESVKKIADEKSYSEDYTLPDPDRFSQIAQDDNTDKEVSVYIVISEEFEPFEDTAASYAPMNDSNTSTYLLENTTAVSDNPDDIILAKQILNTYPNALSESFLLKNINVDVAPRPRDTIIHSSESSTLETPKDLVGTSSRNSVVVENIAQAPSESDSPVRRLYFPQPMLHFEPSPPADSETLILKGAKFMVANHPQPITDPPVSNDVQVGLKWLAVHQKEALCNDSYQPSVQPLENVDMPDIAVTNPQADVPAYASRAEDLLGEDIIIIGEDSRLPNQPYIAQETPDQQRSLHDNTLKLQNNIGPLTNSHPVSPINSEPDEENLVHEFNHSTLPYNPIESEKLKANPNLLSTLPNDPNSATDHPQDTTPQPTQRTTGIENSSPFIEDQKNYKFKSQPTLSITKIENLKPEELGLLSINNQHDGKTSLTNLKNINLSHLVINDAQIPSRENTRDHIESLSLHDAYPQSNSRRGDGEGEQEKNQGVLSPLTRREKADRGMSILNSEPDDVERYQKIKNNRLDIRI